MFFHDVLVNDRALLGLDDQSRVLRQRVTCGEKTDSNCTCNIEAFHCGTFVLMVE
jgi:hypothetical protein